NRLSTKVAPSAGRQLRMAATSGLVGVGISVLLRASHRASMSTLEPAPRSACSAGNRAGAPGHGMSCRGGPGGARARRRIPAMAAIVRSGEVMLEAPDFRGFARFGYLSIAVVGLGFGCWAALAPLGGAVVAPARVSVESESKALQHLEGGIVREILVRESQAVAEGEVLFRLEPIQARANAEMLSKQLDAALAQDARLAAERDDASEIAFPPALMAHRGIAETATAIADQRIQFADRMSARRNELGIYMARLDQTAHEIAGRKAKLAADESQVA